MLIQVDFSFYCISHREKLINACAIASVLFEVLKRITVAANPQVLPFNLPRFFMNRTLVLFHSLLFCSSTHRLSPTEKVPAQNPSSSRHLIFYRWIMEVFSKQLCYSLRFDGSLDSLIVLFRIEF